MSKTETEKQTAGALDIRNVIGALLGVYGVILLADGDLRRRRDRQDRRLNANLYAGLAMLVVGIGFLVWARLRPVVVPEVPAAPTRPRPPPADGRPPTVDPTVPVLPGAARRTWRQRGRGPDVRRHRMIRGAARAGPARPAEVVGRG